MQNKVLYPTVFLLNSDNSQKVVIIPHFFDTIYETQPILINNMALLSLHFLIHFFLNLLKKTPEA